MIPGLQQAWHSSDNSEGGGGADLAPHAVHKLRKIEWAAGEGPAREWAEGRKEGSWWEWGDEGMGEKQVEEEA